MPTWVFMVLTTLVLIGIDVWLWHTDRKTYSEVLRDAAKDWPFTTIIVSVALGVLLGHWFW